MNYISVDILKKYDCCQDQVDLFKELFPSGIVKFNSLREAELLAKKYSSEFDFGYLGYEVFGEVYLDGTKPHCDDYEEANKPLYDAYLGAIKPLLDACEEANKPHKDAYLGAIKSHWGTYWKSTKPYRDTYELVQSQVFAKLWYELEG